MAYQEIICDKEPPIGRIILNEPGKMNPLNWHRLNEVGAAAKEMERDGDIRVIIIKGAGRCFSAGYDITPPTGGGESRNFPPGGVYVSADRDWISGQYNRHHMATYFLIWELDKPVIAQIHGYCLAGATELASFCDLRLLAEGTQVGYPAARAMSTGNIQWMVWLLGMTRAKHFMFTGDSMDAEEALRTGWATAVYPADRLEEETESLARRIAAIPTDLIMLSKHALNAQFEIMGFRTGLMWGSDVLSLMNLRKDSGDFSRIAQEKGLKAALDERDAPFQS